MAGALSFLGGGQVSGMTDTQSDPNGLVSGLIASLQGSPPAPPLRPGTGQDILGSLGDALASMASVRAGRGILPIGPYRAGIQSREAAYQKQLEEDRRANEVLQKQLMIGLIGEGGRERVARIMAATKQPALGAARLEEQKRHDLAMEKKPGNVSLKDLQTGYIGRFDKGGNYLGVAVDEKGQPLRTKEGQSAAGMQVQIDNALDALHNTRDTYNELQKYTLGQKTLGSMGQAVAEAHPSLRGVVEEKLSAGEDAILHDQNINTLSGLVVRPLTNTVRAQGLADLFRASAPRATDTPRVANNFYNQMEGFLQRAKTLPWGSDPQIAEAEYESGAIKSLRTWRTGGAEGSLSVPEPDFQALRSKRQAGKALTPEETSRYKTALEERLGGR